MEWNGRRRLLRNIGEGDDGKEEGKGRESLLFSLLLISRARAHLLGAPSFIIKQLSLNF